MEKHFENEMEPNKWGPTKLKEEKRKQKDQPTQPNVMNKWREKKVKESIGPIQCS